MINFINKLSTTNVRIFVSIFLAVSFVGVVLAGILLERNMPEHVLYIVASFILVMQGLDVKQFKIKRETYIPSPPNTVDIENVGEKETRTVIKSSNEKGEVG